MVQLTRTDATRERLLRRKAELEAAIARGAEEVVELTSSEADEMLSQHIADLSTALELTEQAVGNREAARAELEQVEIALERLDRGTYGKCEDCGRRIAAERLEALPSARRCIDCARAQERARRLHRAAAR